MQQEILKCEVKTMSESTLKEITYLFKFTFLNILEHLLDIFLEKTCKIFVIKSVFSLAFKKYKFHSNSGKIPKHHNFLNIFFLFFQT